MRTYPAILCIIFLIASRADAVEVYQTSAAFVAEAFSGEKPTAKAVWLTGDLKGRVAGVLGTTPRFEIDLDATIVAPLSVLERARG